MRSEPVGAEFRPQLADARAELTAESGPDCVPRFTRQQEIVLQALHDMGVFASAQELLRFLSGQGLRVSLSTVYRTIGTLERLRLVDVVRDDRGERWYRPRSGEGHRHYLMCRECGHGVPIPAESFEEWLAVIERQHGFAEVRHTFDLVGLCGSCSGTRTSAS
ncbi:transcriptional repressor [Streptomyces sp. NA04227]|uniref:Fur family transcriptional regulator n=1 Tax=Streptomyces sp. NA04227 TaxID=2742136 RepID=UPI0015911E3E|nr:transcriptional repressor [Streptomyces sp. NA04227]QKW10437.1 transcriptional repressor [Streptomyces sp. NA04227]